MKMSDAFIMMLAMIVTLSVYTTLFADDQDIDEDGFSVDQSSKRGQIYFLIFQRPRVFGVPPLARSTREPAGPASSGIFFSSIALNVWNVPLGKVIISQMNSSLLPTTA